MGGESDESADLEKLREQLRLCRLELAQVRAEQEALVEDRDALRRRAETSSQRLVELSRALNDHLVSLPGGDGVAAKVGRRVVGVQRQRSSEWQQAERLRRSPLFQGGWYLRQYPAVAATGLAPAVHYLRHGAAEGFDPSPTFSTRGYLLRHPEVAAAGNNPLLHHLEHGRGTQQKKDPRAAEDPTP